MKKQTIFYSVISVAAIISAVSFLFSRYIEYKQFLLSREKVIQDCIGKTVGGTGFYASLKVQECKDRFSK